MPVVPVPLLPEDVHEALLVDDQLMVVLAPFVIEVDIAEMDTVGAAGATLIVMT